MTHKKAQIWLISNGVLITTTNISISKDTQNSYCDKNKKQCQDKGMWQVLKEEKKMHLLIY